MRSAAVALFAGLATASYLPPAPVYEQPEAPVYPSEVAPSSAAPAISSAPVVSEAPYPSAPVDETEYSTLVYTVTSCAPEVTNCPAASTVVSSSFVPLTTSTIYATTVKTIHECAETVTDCPYESKTQVVVTETIAISTTVCPVSEATPAPSHSAPGGYPVPSGPASSKPAVHTSVPAVSHSVPVGYPVPSGPAGGHSTTAEGNKPVYSAPAPVPSHPAEEECVPSKSTTVKTILHTTVLTSYETATIDVPCPSATKPSVVVPPVHPTGGNATVPAVPTYTAPVAAGAAGLKSSALVAAVVGFAAYILA